MPDRPDRSVLRRRFDDAAERYHRIRPRYPEAAFEAIARFGGLAPGDRVLEIGCGSGQATVAFARRGYRVVAVELGPALADLARRDLAAYPDVEVVTADFETYALPDEPFDAVVSATAFHWIDPELRVGRAAAALRTGGTLALVATDHVAGGTTPFFADAQDCYLRFDPSATPGFRLPDPADVDAEVGEIERSGLFGPVEVLRFETEIAYASADYRDLLQTYSDVLALDDDAREGFLDCIASLIDDRFGGRIVKRYLRTLRLARRIA
jgi:SAM-dependent methyltransferase